MSNKQMAPVKKDDLVTVSITDMSEEGEGIGKADGFTLFIKDAVVGDEVTAKVIAVKKGYGYGKVMEILKPSKDRVKPVCPVAAPCGGCQLQALSYESQLRFKGDKVKNHLERIGHLTDVLVNDTIGMDGEGGCWHYRNKAQYPVRAGKDGQIKIGFYAGRTHSIIESDKCFIGMPINEKIVSIVRQWMIDLKVRPYKEEDNSGMVRHIMIRSGYFTGEVMVCLVVNSDKMKNPVKKELVKRLSVLSEIKSICLNINTEKTNVILGKKMEELYGPGYITDTIGDIRYRISAQSFFQVNPLQTKKLYDTALSYAGLTGEETVWDLYCGTGTISLFLAQKAKKVYGVEIIPAAIDNARINAKSNGFDNTEFYVGKAEEVLPRLYKEKGIHADVIVTDPPRKGCEEIVLSTMVSMAPERIVYVSCNSSTLARDLRYLSDHGYQVLKVQPVDMFPQTTGVETVVLLCRKHVDAERHVEVTIKTEDGWRADKPVNATYGQIKEWVAKNYEGMNVSSLYIAQIKEKHGLKERENYNKGKEGARVPQCTAEKMEGIEAALRYFKLI